MILLSFRKDEVRIFTGSENAYSMLSPISELYLVTNKKNWALDLEFQIVQMRVSSFKRMSQHLDRLVWLRMKLRAAGGEIRDEILIWLIFHHMPDRNLRLILEYGPDGSLEEIISTMKYEKVRDSVANQFSKKKRE